MENDRIYKYVIDSINNIVKNGINYYSDKDEKITGRLQDILNYINNIPESTEKEKVDDTIESVNTEEFEANEELNEIIQNFMKKVTDIKISILNLENDLSNYYNPPIEKNDEELILDDDIISDNDISIENYEDNDNDISIDEVLKDSLENNDISKEPISIENNIDINIGSSIDIESLDEEKVMKEVENKKKSFLDIFKKK